jgi:hypothetical protein
MKQKLNIVLVMAMLVLMAAACTKEGEQGPAGPAGTNGTNGTNGNADVRVFLFNRIDTVTSVKTKWTYSLTGITQGYIDSSLVLVYYKDAVNELWYPSPGLGPDNVYQTKWFNFPDRAIECRVADPDGSSYSGGDRNITAGKVVVAKGSTFGKKAPVDFNDYKATMRYFGLPE